MYVRVCVVCVCVYVRVYECDTGWLARTAKAKFLQHNFCNVTVSLSVCACVSVCLQYVCVCVVYGYAVCMCVVYCVCDSFLSSVVLIDSTGLNTHTTHTHTYTAHNKQTRTHKHTHTRHTRECYHRESDKYYTNVLPAIRTMHDVFDLFLENEDII